MCRLWDASWRGKETKENILKRESKWLKKMHQHTCDVCKITGKNMDTRSCRCALHWRPRRKWNQEWGPWAGKKNHDIYGRNDALQHRTQNWASSRKRRTKRTGDGDWSWKHRWWRGETQPRTEEAEGESRAARTTGCVSLRRQPWTWAHTGHPLPDAQPTGNCLPTSGSPWPAGGQCGVGAETSYWELWAQNNSIINNHLVNKDWRTQGDWLGLVERYSGAGKHLSWLKPI